MSENFRKTTITKREVFQVRRRFFISERAALKYYAFSRLFDKYGYLSEVDDVAGLECECPSGSDDDGWSRNSFPNRDYPGCPVHSRKSGYFARVADRFARMWGGNP